VYRRSEQRTYKGSHFPIDSSFNSTRPKVKTLKIERNIKPMVTRVKSTSQFKPNGNTSIMKKSKLVQSSLSSKIKANLIKSKSKTFNNNLVKMNKNKTLLKSKESFEKNYFKSSTIKHSNPKLTRTNTFKQFSRQNSGKASTVLKLRGGLRQKLKNGNKDLKNLPKKNFDLKKRKFLPKKYVTEQRNIKHIGQIEPEKRNEVEEKIRESVVIANIDYDQSKDVEIPISKSPYKENIELMDQLPNENSKNDTLFTERQSEKIQINDEPETEKKEEIKKNENFRTPQKNEDPPIQLNPFARKNNEQIDLKLPDLGVISNEKEKEDQTNLTDRKVDQYLNRRKTKYSKEVANYLQEKEKQEESPQKVKKKTKMVKVIKMKWRESIKAYAQVTEYEEHVEEEVMKTPVKSPIVLDNDSEKVDINRLKKFVNTPKNIKSQLRPEEDNMRTSLPKSESQPKMFDFKKSHSTFNLQSNLKDTDLTNKSQKQTTGSTKKSENSQIHKGFQRQGTTFYEEKKKHFFPIFENFGDCPESQYRLIIYKMDKNSKTDKIFFNNPTNYTFPDKLLTFDMNDTSVPANMSHSLISNLKCSQTENTTKVDVSSRYHDMSSVVNLKKTLKPSLYHDLNALEMDFSFPEDKPKSPKKPKFLKLHNGAEQIDEFTFRIGGIEFKDYRGKANAQSTSNLQTLRNSTITSTSSTSRLGKTIQHKSTSNLLSNSYVLGTTRNGNSF
jgi:hypothetical protein